MLSKDPVLRYQVGTKKIKCVPNKVASECILAGVNDLMLHLVRLSPLLDLYYIFLLQLQEYHEAPAIPKTDKRFFTVVFQWQQKYDKKCGWNSFTFFILLLLVKKLEIILNKHKEWH